MVDCIDVTIAFLSPPLSLGGCTYSDSATPGFLCVSLTCVFRVCPFSFFTCSVEFHLLRLPHCRLSLHTPLYPTTRPAQPTQIPMPCHVMLLHSLTCRWNEVAMCVHNMHSAHAWMDACKCVLSCTAVWSAAAILHADVPTCTVYQRTCPCLLVLVFGLALVSLAPVVPLTAAVPIAVASAVPRGLRGPALPTIPYPTNPLHRLSRDGAGPREGWGRA